MDSNGSADISSQLQITESTRSVETASPLHPLAEIPGEDQDGYADDNPPFHVEADEHLPFPSYAPGMLQDFLRRGADNSRPSQTLPFQATVPSASDGNNTPPHPRVPAILEEILNRTRQPLITEIKDWACSVCHEPYMTGEAPELPLILPCGHIVGNACIMKWLNPLSVQRSNTCGECRAPILRSWNKNDFRTAGSAPPPEAWQQIGAGIHFVTVFTRDLMPAMRLRYHDNGRGVHAVQNLAVEAAQTGGQEPTAAFEEFMAEDSMTQDANVDEITEREL